MAEEEIKEETFEDLIIKSKKKQTKNLLLRLSLTLIIYSLVIVYFFIPVSRVSNNSISGNVLYTNDEVIKIGGLSNYQSLYTVNADSVKESIKNNPLFVKDSISVGVSPLGLSINAEEIIPVFYSGSDIYGSDAIKMDKELFNDQDPLISDHLKECVEKGRIITYLNDPSNQEIKDTFKRMCGVIRSLDNYGRETIKYLRIEKDNDLIAIYVPFNEYLLKIVFPMMSTSFSDNDIKEMCTKDRLNKIISNTQEFISNPPTGKEVPILFEESILEENKKMYSVKCIKIQTESEVSYEIVANNPTK